MKACFHPSQKSQIVATYLDSDLEAGGAHARASIRTDPIKQFYQKMFGEAAFDTDYRCPVVLAAAENG
jgi:hypothetical protein